MTTNSEINHGHVSMRAVQVGFYAAAIVFNLCLIAQVITVGVAYFVNPNWWTIHVWLVRGYGGLTLLLLAWSFVAAFPPQIKRLTASLPVLLGLQFVSIHLKSPLHLEVLHPLIGFSLFYVSASLVHHIGRSAKHQQDKRDLVEA